MKEFGRAALERNIFLMEKYYCRSYNERFYFLINNAAKKGWNDILYFFIEKNINIEEGRSCPMLCAIENGHLHTVIFLKRYGYDIMQNSGFGFRIACRNGHLHIVRFYVQHNINKEKVPHAIFTCLRLNIFNVVDYLLPKYSEEFYKSCFRSENMEKYEKYLSFKRKYEHKAATKIYFWWIPICYDVNRDCGKRMMERSWERVQNLYKNIN